MRVELTTAQYFALNDLRGLPSQAHMLVMRSKPTASGGVLEGSQAAFEELVSAVSSEIADGMVSQGAIRALVSACVKIDPDCADWLGM